MAQAIKFKQFVNLDVVYTPSASFLESTFNISTV